MTQAGPSTVETAARALSWEVAAGRCEEFRALGLKQRYFFPHQLRFLRRFGSDGFRLAERMYGLELAVSRPAPRPGVLNTLARLVGVTQPRPECFQLVLHAAPEVCREFPAELFFCRDLIWHQQHLGLPGHIAVADLVLVGRRLYTTARFSDVVQRIPRRRDLKNRIERVFRGWDQMLLNGIVHFALRRGVRDIWFPTAELARENTDRRRDPQPALFVRVYDAHLAPFNPRRQGRVWIVDPRAAARRLVAPALREELCDLSKTVCIVHDTERGYGYRGIDDGFADRADHEAPEALARMLDIEAHAGIRTTYSVVGCMLGEVRTAIESGGHALAFHSYDHTSEGDQLHLCRTLDYRLPGYRPPRSRITPDLADHRLTFHNFEWLASSERSLGFAEPRQENGLTKLPIRFDDHSLHTGELAYANWWNNLSATLNQRDFVAFGLHDCYAQHWLAHYPKLLSRLAESATLRRLDEVSNLLARRTAV